MAYCVEFPLNLSDKLPVLATFPKRADNTTKIRAFVQLLQPIHGGKLKKQANDFQVPLKFAIQQYPGREAVIFPYESPGLVATPCEFHGFFRWPVSPSLPATLWIPIYQDDAG